MALLNSCPSCQFENHRQTERTVQPGVDEDLLCHLFSETLTHEQSQAFSLSSSSFVLFSQGSAGQRVRRRRGRLYRSSVLYVLIFFHVFHGVVTVGMVRMTCYVTLIKAARPRRGSRNSPVYTEVTLQLGLSLARHSNYMQLCFTSIGYLDQAPVNFKQ